MDEGREAVGMGIESILKGDVTLEVFLCEHYKRLMIMTKSGQRGGEALIVPAAIK